jgi:hypothetical protein
MTWLPGAPIDLGSVGLIEDGVFRPITTLKNLGIPFDKIIDKDKDSIDYSSSSGVSITFKAAGETNSKFKALTDASAGALIEFSRSGAIVLQLRGVANHRIADQPKLYKELLRSVVIGDEDKWQRDWVVITEVVQTDQATIIISDSSNSKLELKASGSVAPMSLVDVSGNLSVAGESQVSTKLIANSGLTPLYRGVRVKKKFLWLFDEVQPASSNTPEADEVFDDAVPEEDDAFANG